MVCLGKGKVYPTALAHPNSWREKVFFFLIYNNDINWVSTLFFGCFIDVVFMLPCQPQTKPGDKILRSG